MNDYFDLKWPRTCGAQLWKYSQSLGCQYCAYGIEKKIRALDGVDGANIEIKLNEGLVIFQTHSTPQLTEDRLKTLINDAGFTLHSYQSLQLDQTPVDEPQEIE